ncbi:MAG: GGDEF domain-containing protein, partial [Delftia sp.]|nr:GGDEF domain-containing protein [Delftia sp.]
GVAAAQAWALAGQLREAIRSTPIQVHGLELAATASFGVAQLQGAESAQELLQRADAMLYEAKHAGRDCVRVAGLT